MPEQPPPVSRGALRGFSGRHPVRDEDPFAADLALKRMPVVDCQGTSGKPECRGIYDFYAPPVIPSVRLTSRGFTDLSCTGGQRRPGASRGRAGRPTRRLYAQHLRRPGASSRRRLRHRARTTRPATRICTTATQTTPNVSTDCAELGPHNETSIAVNPTNPHNMIGGANDYQLGLNPGGHVRDSAVAGARDVRRRQDLVRVPALLPAPPTRRPAIRQSPSTPRARLLCDAGLPVRRTENALNPDVAGRQLGRRRTDVVVSRASPPAAATREAPATCSTRNTSLLGATATPSSLTATSGWARRAILSGQHLQPVTHDGGKTWSTPHVISGSPRPGIRLRSHGCRRRPHLRRVPNTTDLQHGSRRLRGG